MAVSQQRVSRIESEMVWLWEESQTIAQWADQFYVVYLIATDLDYTHVKQTGYRDPTTDEFLMVKEMIPELVVPDISNFPLKPYVSYRADVEIEKR